MFCTKVDQKDIATWKKTCVAEILFFWRRVANWCWQRISTLVEQGDNYRTCGPPIPNNWGPQFGATLVDLHLDLIAPLVNCHYLMDNRLEECRLFLCLSFVPDWIPPGGGGGGNFVPPLVWDLIFLRPICLVIHFLPSLCSRCTNHCSFSI